MSGEYFGFNSTQERTLRTLLGAGTDGSIDTANLADGAVTTDKLDADAVDGTKIADDAVDTEHLAAGAVTNAEVDAAAAIAATKLAVAAGTEGLGATNVQVSLQTAYTAIANLNTWAAALATKLNADAGVTDVDYDTDPQA